MFLSLAGEAPTRANHQAFEAVVDLLPRVDVDVGPGSNLYEVGLDESFLDIISLTSQAFICCRLGTGCKFGADEGELDLHFAGSRAATRTEDLSTISLLRLAAAQAHVLYGKLSDIRPHLWYTS